MKATFHKSCSCSSCRRGRRHQKFTLKMNERKLRRRAKAELIKFLKGAEDVFIHPITSPYTD